MAQGWYDHDWPLPEEIDLLAERGRLREGALVFEIGAHQGVVAMMLGDRVGPGGSVVAVEATLHNAEVAWRNVALNGLTQVAVVHAAGADAPGVPALLTANERARRRRRRRRSRSARSPRRAHARQARRRLLFVDVEGYELHVLRGALHTLESAPSGPLHRGTRRRGPRAVRHGGRLLATHPFGVRDPRRAADRGPFLPLAVARDVLRHHSRLVALWSGSTRGP